MTRKYGPEIYLQIGQFCVLTVFLFLSSCGFKSASKGEHTGKVISGIITPFLGLIAESPKNSLILNYATADTCANPVNAKLYKIESDGSIKEDSPLSSQQIGSDARYSFDLKDLGITYKNNTVEFIIKAEGCNGNVYKRPVTEFNSKQDVSAKSTVVAEVINASNLVNTKLNEVERKKVEILINSLDGTSTSTALDSLINKTESANTFTQIFGSSPTVIQDSKPEVALDFPKTTVNELAVSSFKVNAFHVDPNYVFAYKWKLDGVIVGLASTFNYIPSANESGLHQLALYIGKNDGSGNIDLTKPYYTNTFSVSVNNNILPTPPNIAVNTSTPSPRNINTVQVDLNTGVALSNCASFSKLAITDTFIIPGILQFNISCATSGTQLETIQFSSGDGTKTLYLWAMDTEGNISPAKTISLMLDTQPPALSLTSPPSLLKGGTTHSLSLSASDAGVGLSTLDLYFSTNGGTTYSLLSHIATSATQFNWSVPSIDTTNGKLKVVATDLTTSATTVYSTNFEIDSLAPTAPAISRISNSASNSSIVNINTTCSADYFKILYSQSGSTPSDSDSAWENCANTKNFTVSMGDGLKTIYAFTKDIAENISSSSSLSMTLDTTAPSAPVASLTSPSISGTSASTFTIADCLDRPYIFVSESMISPLASDSNWQACSTNANAISYTLIGPVQQGTHTLYVYAKDSVGNISASTASSMNFDTTKPILNLSTTLATLYKGGDSITLNFSASDTSGLTSLKLYYTLDGSTYSQVVSLATSATNYTWTIPSDNTTVARLKLIAIDNADPGNESIVYSNVFAIDSTAPSAPVIARSSSQYSSSNIVIVNTTCTADYSQILYTETASTPALSDSSWETCSSTKSFTTTTGNGVKTIYAFSRDTAGNISTSSNITMTLDTTLPALALTGFSTGGFFLGGTSQNITWSASDANLANSPITLAYSTDGTTFTTIATNLVNSGSYSWSLPSIESATVKIKITALDLAGNTASINSGNFGIDSTPPSVDGLSLNGGAPSTTNNNVQVSLNAHDNLTKIQFFCLKYDDSTKPLANSSCWKDVTAPVPGIAAATTITFSGFYFQMGFTKGTSSVYAWVKDETGQISDNAAVINKDTYSITFDPGTPPTLGAVQVANTNTPPSPLTANELITAVGTDLYVKWNAADLEGLATNPITIKYTTDDINFNAITNGTDLANGANGTCTVDPGFTGCAKLIAPTSSYYKIRVIAKDTLGTTVFLNSSSLNETKLKILAGNTDDGLNGSAISAVLYTYGSSKNVTYGFKNRLVVSDDGKFFYIDNLRGLLWIDPSNGVLKKFIPTTGTSSGDGGLASNATLREASAIALDYHNNLLIWDFNRIRKVDLTTMSISTLLGGGATTDPTGTVNATEIALPSFHKNWGNLIPMPNGNIIFDAPSTSLHHRKYRATDGKIELMDLQGTGFTNFPTDAWTASAKVDIGLVFNPTTSAVNFMAKGFFKSVVGDTNTQYTRIDHNVGNETTPYPGISPYNLPFTNSSLFTGMDGRLYLIDRFRTGLYRYDHVSNVNTRVLGTGASSSTPCAENSLATSCAIDIDSVFIAKTSRIYFIDNGVLRTIDDSNKVITLFGQFPSFGNGSLATTARFGAIQDIKMGKNAANKILVEDAYSNEFREFSIEGSLNKVADANFTWHGTFRFEVDPLTGDIFSPNGASLRRFDRLTNLWSVVAGGGTTNYFDPLADGKTGTQINFNSAYHAQLLGYINNKLYYQKYAWASGANMGCYLKTYDTSDLYRQAHFMGTGTCAGGITNGGLLANNVVNTTNITNIEYFQDPVDSTNKFFLGQTGGAGIYAATAGGNISLYASLSHAMNSFTHNFTANGLTFYYCSTAGYLYKRVMSTGQTVQLPWLSPTIRCKASKTIIYNSDRNSLIFPIVQNGLDGVAEYSLNP